MKHKQTLQQEMDEAALAIHGDQCNDDCVFDKQDVFLTVGIRPEEMELLKLHIQKAYDHDLMEDSPDPDSQTFVAAIRILERITGYDRRVKS